MVVFVDYDEEDSYNDAHHHHSQDIGKPFRSDIEPIGNVAASTVSPKYTDTSSASSSVDTAAGRTIASTSIESTLNLDAFGRSLTCYP